MMRLLVALALLAGCPTEQEIEAEGKKAMDKIEDQVATDAENEYGIAKRNGSPMDRCVQAGFVVAAWLQAGNEPKYKHWKAIEKTECAAAGMVE